MNAILLAAALLADPNFDAVSVGVLPCPVEAAKQANPDVKFPPRGMFVVDVEAYSSAHAGGVIQSDVITKIMNKPVSTSDDFSAVIDSLSAGQEVPVELYRPKEVRGKLVYPATAKRAKIKMLSRRQFLQAAVKKHRDEIEAIDFWEHVDTPSPRKASSLVAYFGEKDGKVQPLRIRVSYIAEDWVHATKWVVRAGEQRFEFTAPTLADVTREVQTDPVHIAEWYDFPASPDDIEMLKAIGSSAKECPMRYEGSKVAGDRNMESAERRRIQAVLDAYVMRGGELPK